MGFPSLKSHTEPNTPIHVAIIMDGNGRWAKSRGKPRIFGHKKGAESVRTTVESAVELGIQYLTLYGFSSENWNRPADEVSDLMGLLRVYLKSEVKKLNEKDVRFKVIGDRKQLSADIITLIEKSEKLTESNQTLVLTIALSYGGRDELVRAAQRLASDVVDQRLEIDQIDGEAFSSHLYTCDMPDPDLLIRTSGEQRISNFLLWQLAYTEFVFLETLWPDFGYDEFASAVEEFRSRERRYGNS